MNDKIWWEEKNCYGYKICPKWLKWAYLKAVNYMCQECNNKFKDLEPHRIIRHNHGGLYTVAALGSKASNVKVLCKDCHKSFHRSEFK